MAESITVPELPPLSRASGDELIAVWKDDRLVRLPQASLRGTQTFSGPSDPPLSVAAIVALNPVIGDRWRNTLTGDEWKVTTLEPFTWGSDGNVSGPPGPSVPGPPGVGKTGPAGPSGRVETKVAGAQISNWTAVVLGLDDRFVPADPTNPLHRQRVIGVVATGGPFGALLTAQTAGSVKALDGGFVSGTSLFVGLGGALVRTPPTSGWRQIVATASSSDQIVVALGEASVITPDADAMIGEGGFSTPASVAEIVTGQGERKYVRSSELGLALPQILLRQPTILLWLFDNLPILPSDPADYPLEGGLFRNGDTAGYSLVRIYPSGGGSPSLAQARALGLTDDLREALTTVLLGVLDATSALPTAASDIPASGGLFRNGDANGYSLTRIYPAR